MINVEVEYRPDRIRFRATGHALFAKSSRNYDLVCCAVSTLIQNWHLSLTELCRVKVDAVETENPGHFEIITDNNPEAELLFRSLMFGLANLQAQYPQNIKILMEDNHGS